MLLTIDVGNTQTVMGLFAESGESPLVAHWRLSTVGTRTPDEHRLLLEALLERDGFGFGDLGGAALASVVPPAGAALRTVLGEAVEGPTVVVGPGVDVGIPIDIDNPTEVGADRVANATAALHRYGAPAVVVDFGTSTNFDVVSPDGRYVGGVIATGLEVTLDALVGATAALRRIELVPPPAPVGRGTVQAMQSGLLYGHAGLVDGLMERIVAQVGPEAHRIATGGLAATIVPHCRTVEVVDEFLTLEGLRLVYRRNVDV